MTSAPKILTTVTKMALCVIIPRDHLIALANLDLPEMDTIAQVTILVWQKRCEEKTLLNLQYIVIGPHRKWVS